MPTTIVKTWPTLQDVEPVVALLEQAYNAVDGLSLSVHGLIDTDDPWEPVEGVPAPSLEDVGVLTYLTMSVGGRIEGLTGWLEDFRVLRDSASYREARERGGAS